jgi:hypothetical protein
VVFERRRARERAARHALIIQTARQIAETDGWDAVTTRRLAETIEYSQPVLYSHFANKDAIVAPERRQCRHTDVVPARKRNCSGPPCS